MMYFVVLYYSYCSCFFFFFFQAEDGIRDVAVTGVQTCALPILILGSFARNDVLLGPRGYRRTLLETGRLVQEIVHQAKRLGLTVRPLYEFTDRDVDTVMEADGIEQSTLMAFEFGGTTNVS